MIFSGNGFVVPFFLAASCRLHPLDEHHHVCYASSDCLIDIRLCSRGKRDEFDVKRIHDCIRNLQVHENTVRAIP